MIKRSICSAFALVVVFICLVAMMCPLQELGRVVPNGEPIETVGAERVERFANCVVSEDGSVTVTGDDPSVIIYDIEGTFEAVTVNFLEPLSQPVSGQLYYDNGDGFSEEDSVVSSAFQGDNQISFDVAEADCTVLRIDIDIDYRIKNVELYDTNPLVVTQKLEQPLWEYILCAVIAVAVALTVFFTDLKFKFTERIGECIKNNIKSVFIGLAAVISALLISAVIEYIIATVICSDALNLSRFYYICGIVLSLFAMLLFMKNADKTPERLFLCLVLIAGGVMILAAPFGHISWDTETHYKWALDASYIGNAYQTPADSCVIGNKAEFWSFDSLEENKNSVLALNGMDDYIINEFKLDKRITHIPSGVFIALARFFNADFYWKYTLGKVPNLLIYAFACYFAMKKLKSGKMILAVIAFFPTNLLLATNYSYDYWVTSLSILGMAYFVSEMQQPEKQITVKESIIMCGALALACVPKQIYAPMLLIPFFLRKKDKKINKKYYAVCVCAFVILAVMLAVRSFSSVSSVGDLRGGAGVSPIGQVKFILGNPFAYAKILIKFLIQYLSPLNADGYITLLGYLDSGKYYILMLILMIVTAFTDKNEYDLQNKYLLIKCVNILLLAGVSCLLATSMYVAFTPVGLGVINGCQSRYLTPLIYPVLSVIGSKMINNKINRKLYNTAIMLVCMVVVYASVATTMLSRLV